MSNIFQKEESTESFIARHWKDEFLCTIWNIKCFKFSYGCILHSKIFPTSTHTPKSELKRRSYGPDKLEKKNQLLSRKLVATRKIMSRPENLVATRKLGRDQEIVSRPENLVATKNAAETSKRLKIEFLTSFQAHFTLGPYIYSFSR